jgi:SAM-dependent methyltransferase
LKGFAVDLSAYADDPSAQIDFLFARTLKRLNVIGAASKRINRPYLDLKALTHAKPSPWTPIPSSDVINYVTGDAGSEEEQRASYLMSGMINAADVINTALAYGLDPYQPGFRILDIGCGCGRLTSFLCQFAPTCDYLGVDVSRDSVEWANNAISSAFANVKFERLETDANGYIGQKCFALPCPDNDADLVMATSLFTHLDEQATNGYFKEILRVLKPNGLAYLTCFILDHLSESGAEATASRAGRTMTKTDTAWWHGSDGYLDVYYKESTVRDMLKSSGLNLVALRRGYWSGGIERGDNPAAYQDLILASKPA